MRVTYVSEPRGNFVDVVVRFDGEITMDGVVAARDWFREQLGVELSIGIVMSFAPSRAVLSVPVALEARVRAMICDPSADTEGSGA